MAEDPSLRLADSHCSGESFCGPKWNANTATASRAGKHPFQASHYGPGKSSHLSFIHPCSWLSVHEDVAVAVVAFHLVLFISIFDYLCMMMRLWVWLHSGAGG